MINDNECQRRAVGVDIVTELAEEKRICVDLAHKGNNSRIYMNSNGNKKEGHLMHLLSEGSK